MWYCAVPCGVVGRRFLAVDRPPRVERADLVDLFGPLAGLVELAPPEAHHLARHLRARVGEERHHVRLGVPEVVAFVAAAGHAFGGDALLLGLGAGLGQLEQVPAHGLLAGFIAEQLDVAALPEVVQPCPLLGQEQRRAVLLRALERAVAPVGQLLGRHAGRRVVRDELDDADHLPRLDTSRDDRLGEIRSDRRRDLVRGGGLDDVAIRAGQRHPTVCTAIAEDDLAIVVEVQPRHEHAVVEGTHLAGVPTVTEGGGGNVVLILAVLAVEQLRRDDDGRGAVEHRHLERHHGKVAVGEAD